MGGSERQHGDTLGSFPCLAKGLSFFCGTRSGFKERRDEISCVFGKVTLVASRSLLELDNCP